MAPASSAVPGTLPPSTRSAPARRQAHRSSSALADEEGVDSRPHQKPPSSSARPQPALAHGDDVGRQPGGDFVRGTSRRRTSSVRRFRLLTPTMRAPAGEGALQLCFVVHLDQRGQPERPAAPAARVPASSSARHDQQHRIGAGRPRFEQLVLVDDEVLPQQGHRHRGRTAERCSERAVEERRARSAPRWPRRRPTRTPRDAGRVVVLRSTPRDGERRLHSAMTLMAPGRRQRGLEEPVAAVPFGRTRDRRLERLGRPRALAHLDDPPRGRDDRGEQVGRCRRSRRRRLPPRVRRPTSRARTARAAPLSMAAAACAMASPKVRGAPGNEQRGAGVEQHDVARRPGGAVEHPAHDRRVARRRRRRVSAEGCAWARRSPTGAR
jgi:hypothetical protein